MSNFETGAMCVMLSLVQPLPQRRNTRGANFLYGNLNSYLSCDGDERPFVICDPNSPPGSFWYEIPKNRDAFVFYMTNTDRDERLSGMIRFLLRRIRFGSNNIGVGSLFKAKGD